MDSPAVLLRRYGLQPKKSWGQCFLHDPGFVARIVAAAGVVPEDTVVEIGAGLGTLTAALAERAARVIAVERERDMVAVLQSELGGRPAVVIAEENALTFDFARAAGEAGRPLLVVGNLPYQIASPLLFRLLAARAHLRAATVMLQRELAARIVAAPGTREYGAPSVLIRAVADARLCFTVPPAAFVPRPRVTSAVVRLDFLARPRVQSLAALEPVVRLAFQLRRKTLRRALASRYAAPEIAAALAGAAIDGQRRGETLTLEEFAALAAALEGRG